MSPALQGKIREAHPEVSFAAIGGKDQGMKHYKKTPEGEAERLAVLSRFFGGAVRTSILSDRAALRISGAARDDVLDALVCLATAYRIAGSTAIILPRGSTPLDSKGLRMEIVA